MTITTIYQPEVFDVDPVNEYYDFTFENTGPDSIEIYEVDADENFTFVHPNKYALIFDSYKTGEDFIRYGGRLIIKTKNLLSTTEIIFVSRNTIIDQTVDLERVKRFPMETVEFVLDKLTMICQELDYRLCPDPDGIEVTTEITQLINWYAYDKFPAAEINDALDKLTQICLEIDGAKLDEEYLPS